MQQDAGTTGNGAYRESSASVAKEWSAAALRTATTSVAGLSRYFKSHNLDAFRRDLDGRLRAHPVNTALIGLGVGFLLGKLWRK